MATQKAVNTFRDGQNVDIDQLGQPNTTSRLSVNGRIVFNDGATYDWENERGQVISFTIDARNGTDPNPYTPIGAAGNSNLVVLFSVDPANGSGEIGIFTTNANGIGTYKTMFNDQDDPDGDSLNFSVSNQIEARFLYETDECIRVYWSDGVQTTSNRPRVFTFEYDTALPADNVNAYTPVTDAVHSINLQADVRMGLIKFVQYIGGSLLSGIYQYSYRLGTSDGYRTPWYPISRSMFITTDAVSNSNWNEYEMEGSGIGSSKGIRLEIKGIDDRYDIIELVYVYSQTEFQPFEANIFAEQDISSTTMQFDHVSNSGVPIEASIVAARNIGLGKIKTLNIRDRIMYHGNIEELTVDFDEETILQNLTITPTFRDMRSDEENYGNLTSPPITHQTLKTGTTTKQLHTGTNETYQIVNDYVNYKGGQVFHQYRGYFRGETYRLALVFHDLIGNPAFAIHLGDIHMPDQYDTAYSWNRVRRDGTIQNFSGNISERAWPTTSYNLVTEDPVVDGHDPTIGDFSYLRIMGLEIGGIDISSVENQISGFQIVRAPRDETIVLQGLIMPCVRDADITRPFVAANQAWADFTQVGNEIMPGSNPSDIELLGQRRVSDNNERFLIRPYISVFYAPDYDFETERRPVVQTNDQLRLVGGCWTETNDNVEGNEVLEFNQQFTHPNKHCLQKLYNTKNDFHLVDVQPRPTYGTFASIEQDFSLGLGDQEADYVPGLDLDNSVEFFNQEQAGFNTGFELFGWGKGKSLFYIHGNFGAGLNNHAPYYLNTEDADSPYSGYFICNYTRPNTSPYGGLTLSALQQTIFEGTGHFQPVGNPVFPTPANGIFNGIEVFGGDCFLDLFGFLRVYPRYMNIGSAGPYNDCAYGHVFPLESTICHSLRQAASEQNPMYTDVGSRPQTEYENQDTNWTDGLYIVDSELGDELREEFNFNPVLTGGETTQFYFTEPVSIKDVVRFPIRWRNSNTKIYGDPVDAFRIFSANDFQDLNGRYGPITSSEYIFDQIYSFQESAFGRLRALDRALIESTNQGTLTTGIGPALDGIDYISTVHGNQHQWSLSSSGKALYWVDVDKRKICRFAQDGFVALSDVRGAHAIAINVLPNFENRDNPVFAGGVHTNIDFQNNEIHFVFVDRIQQEGVPQCTLLYNEYNDKFTGFLSACPTLLIQSKGDLLAHDNNNVQNEIYVYNKGDRGSFFGTVYPSLVTVVLNDNPLFSKAYDNIRMSVNIDGYPSLETVLMITENQNELLTVAGDDRFQYKEGIYRFPLRGQTQASRMRGKFMEVVFQFDNTLNQPVKLSNLVTHYRISNRI